MLDALTYWKLVSASSLRRTSTLSTTAPISSVGPASSMVSDAACRPISDGDTIDLASISIEPTRAASEAWNAASSSNT